MFPKVENPGAGRIEEKAEIRAAIMRRVEAVREEIGETPTQFARRMGAEYKHYDGWVKRGSIELAYVVKLAQSLNLSLDYLCCLTHTPYPPGQAAPVTDYWSAIAASQNSSKTAS